MGAGAHHGRGPAPGPGPGGGGRAHHLRHRRMPGRRSRSAMRPARSTRPCPRKPRLTASRRTSCAGPSWAVRRCRPAGLDAALAAGAPTAPDRHPPRARPSSPLGRSPPGPRPGQAALLQRVRERRDAAGLLETSLAPAPRRSAPGREQERLRTLTRRAAPPGGRGCTLAQQVSREEGERRAPPSSCPVGGGRALVGGLRHRAGAQPSGPAWPTPGHPEGAGPGDPAAPRPATRDVQDLTAPTQRRQARLARLREDEGPPAPPSAWPRAGSTGPPAPRPPSPPEYAAQTDLQAFLTRTEQTEQVASPLASKSRNERSA